MCGRYSLIADLSTLGQRFSFDARQLSFEASYNIAPTQQVLTVVGGKQRRGGFMRWGLVPHWAKDLSGSARMINARAETVAERPAFRDALRRRRCLVLADGFYEWHRSATGRTPIRIVMRSGGTIRVRGALGRVARPGGQPRPSCTIITTAANDLLAPIHDRMPVVLPAGLEELWLDRSVDDPDVLASVLSPYADDALAAYEVSTLVNSAANNGPELIEAVA